MIRFRRTPDSADANGAPDPIELALAADLTILYAVEVPALDLPAVATASATPPRQRSRWPRALAGAAGVAVVAAALLVVPAIWGSGAPRVSAQEIFSRANAVAVSNATTGQPSYHLIAESAAGKGGAVFNTRTETWAADATHVRQESTGGGGTFATVANGDEGWLAIPVDGQLRVAHVSTGGAEFANQQSRAGSLTEFLAALDEKCQSASSEGESTLLGRPVYVISLAPGSGCTDVKMMAGAKGSAPSTRMWVDKETFIPLKTVAYDSSGGIGFRYEVTTMETGLTIPASTFIYAAPAGVSVIEVADAAHAKMAIAGEPKTTSTRPDSKQATATK